MSLPSMPFHLPPTISQSLGDVVMASSRIDALLAEFLSFLIKANPGYMYVLNQDIAGGTQLKWIRILVDARITNENTLKGLKLLFGRIDIARRERNTYVHGVWGPSSQPMAATIQTVKLDRAEIVLTELVTRPDLDELFDELTSIADELHAIGVKLKFIHC